MGNWLEGLSLGEYRENFIRNDIRGSELIVLERRDLKVGIVCFLTDKGRAGQSILWYPLPWRFYSNKIHPNLHLKCQSIVAGGLGKQGDWMLPNLKGT